MKTEYKGDVMDDLISRQAAIDALTKTIAVNKNPNHDARVWEEGMNCALTIIGALPSAQPEQRWIPVSERLPEGGHNIIFCDSKGNVCEGVYHAIPGQWVGFRWNAIYHHDDVTAWMPLPDPYKEEE